MGMAAVRKWLSCFALLVAMGWVLSVSRVGLSKQPKPKDEDTKNGKSPTRFYFGAEACVECHSDGAKRRPVLCRCTEVAIWEKFDKHPLAYKILKEKRAQEMGKALNIEDVSKEKACVNCHGVYLDAAQLQDKELVDPTFKMSEGVNCVACHGAYADWVDAHAKNLEKDRVKWRSNSREYKEKHYGMTDLWDPSKRAKLCLSCHVGNTEEGKVVTHAMYAAGHPPLPGVELGTFSDEMPRHWQYITEKKPEAQKLLQFNPEEVEFEQTRLVLVSGMASFREAMNLLASGASAGAQAKDEDKAWPELAQFDCYACHHELKTPAWRQTRGYKGRPGRPNMRPWPLELVRVDLRALGEDERVLAEQLRPLHEAFNATPFGKPDRVAADARKVADWADGQIKKLKELKITRPIALSILRSLCTIPEGEFPDYDSARQLSWAANVIYRELKPKPDTNEKIMEKLADLDKQLKLKLPSGQTQSVVGELSQNLKKLEDYDPYAFKATMKELLDLLPQEAK